MRAIERGILIAVLLSAGVASRSPGQAKYPDVKLSGRLQEQFFYFGNEAYAPEVGTPSDFLIRRARIEARGQISENVSLYIQPSFEGGRRSGVRLRDAYIDVRLGPDDRPTSLYLRGGQEKRPFSRYELTSSNNLPSIERGAGQGLPGRATNNLFEGAGFLSHDVGASLRVEHELDEARMVTVKLGVYNGQGESLNDVNGRKSVGARGTVAVSPKVDLGASWFAHDGIVTVDGVPDSGFTNSAFEIDGQYGKPGDPGLYAVAEYLQGTDATAQEARMRGFQVVAAYNVPVKGPTGWVSAVEPALRLDLADPNRDLDDDRVTTVTAVVGLYLSSRAWLRLAYERQSFQAGDSESVSGIRSMLAVNF